jgi:hypothetical protein
MSYLSLWPAGEGRGREGSLCESAAEPARTTRDNPSFGHAASLSFIVCMNIFVELSPPAKLAIETVPWFPRVWGFLAESELLRDRTCCSLNYICDFLGMRDVD